MNLDFKVNDYISCTSIQTSMHPEIGEEFASHNPKSKTEEHLKSKQQRSWRDANEN